MGGLLLIPPCHGALCPPIPEQGWREKKMKRQLVSTQTQEHPQHSAQLPRMGTARMPEALSGWTNMRRWTRCQEHTPGSRGAHQGEQRPDTSTHPPGGQQPANQPPAPPQTDSLDEKCRLSHLGLCPELVPSPRTGCWVVLCREPE